MVMNRIRMVALASLMSVPGAAQERVYVAQRSPAAVHAFSFAGGTWTREDASPADPTTLRLQVGLDPFNGVTATDHLILTGSGFTGLGIDAVDPFTGLELPRVRTTVTLGPVKLSADQHYAFVAGPNPIQLPSLSVVDLNPASPQFLKEVASLVGVASGQTASFGATALSGTTLYMALLDPSGAFGFAPHTKIVAIDVSNPLAPAVLGSTIVTQTLTPALAAGMGIPSLRAFDLGGTTYLFLCRRDLVILQAGPLGALTQLGQVASNRPVAPAGRRVMRDVYARQVAGVRRAFVASDVNNLVEEILVVNLDTLSNDQAGASVLSSKTLSTSGSPDNDRVRASLDGSHLYVLSQGGNGFPLEVAQLNSLDITGVLNESTAVATIPIDGSVQSAPDFDVRPAVTAVSSGLVSSVLVSGATPANLLVNDAPRTVTIGGSGLGAVTHAFVGLDRLTLGTVSANSVTATSPALLPAGDRPVVVVDSLGGISAFGGPGVPGALAVVNSPTAQPPEVVYAAANAVNRVAVLHAASETQIVSSFPVSDFPTNMAITPDGALLFVSQFTAGRVEAFSLVNDSIRGWTVNQKVASLHVGGAPQALTMKKDASRLYVTTLDGYVAVIDSSARPPVLIDVDNNPATIDPEIDALLSPGLSRIVIANFDAFGNPDDGSSRSLTLSDDDQWLYVGRSTAPHIVAVHVDDDLVPISDRTFFSIPALPGLLPPGNGRRVDGLAVRGARLYFASSGDSSAILRLFDISGATITPAAVPSLALPAGAAPGVRTLKLSDDGKFLYAACRTPGSDVAQSSVHIMDAAADTWVASLGVGAFAAQVSVSPTSNFAYVGSTERDVVYTIDARPGPTRHTIISATGGPLGIGSTAVSPGLITPVGASVEVSPAPNVNLTFSNIAVAGNTTVTTLNVTPLTMPEGFSVLNVVGNPVYYEIKTTATFTSGAKVCLTYTDSQVMGVDESVLRLMHEEGGMFVDRTIGMPDTNPSANRICGSVSGFSQFAIGVRTGARTLCSVLGREGHPQGRDVDTFEFEGAVGEQVSLRLDESPDPGNGGDRVKIVLLDKIKGRKLKDRDNGSLPLSIDAILPASGRYIVRIERKTGAHGFHGSYCVTLQSSAAAFTSFAARPNVEP